MADECTVDLVNNIRFDGLNNNDLENPGGAAMTLIKSDTNISNVVFNNLKS